LDTDVNATSRSLLVLFRHAPYGSGQARGGYDLALASAAFEQPVSLLFMDDGVWHLLADQAAARIDKKSIESTLASLPLYDIETLYAEASSLESRGLATGDLAGNVAPLDADQVRELLDSHDQVVMF
jgi:tRNA 2-thiouridine synthesizing protein C